MGRCGRQDLSPSLWMWRQDSDSPPKLYSWPLPFLLWESTALHSNYRNTQQKNPRNWVTAAMLLSLGFKGWWNTQRKTLWSNLAKGGKAPTAWQGLMSENTDPITCPSIAANPPAGLVGCSSDGRQLCRAASVFLFPFLHCDCPTTEGQQWFSWDFLDTSRPTD